MKKIKNNSVVNIVFKVFKGLITLFIILVVSIIFMQRVSDNKANFLGFGMYTVVSESMLPKYEIGDMVVSKKINYDNLKVYDDVVYLGKTGDFNGRIVTHQVIEKGTDNKGRYVITKGINNMIEDPVVYEDQIIGKVIHKGIMLSFVSKIVNNAYGFFLVIFIPFAIIIAMEIFDVVNKKKEEE